MIPAVSRKLDGVRRAAARVMAGRVDRPIPQRLSIRVASFDAGAAGLTLLLRADSLAPGAHLRTATVVRETAGEVLVAMTYDDYDCRCSQSMIGTVGAMAVTLQTPLGQRVVRDELTGGLVPRS